MSHVSLKEKQWEVWAAGSSPALRELRRLPRAQAPAANMDVSVRRGNEMPSVTVKVSTRRMMPY